MKLRILGNTLRLRLSQTEVEKLGMDGHVNDATEFPGNNALTYQINRSSSDSITCSLVDNVISVNVPEDLINEWVNTDRVGFQEDFELAGSSKLSILVEKDFKCLT